MAQGKRSGNRFRRGWSREEVIEKIRQWVELYDEPPRLSDWDPANARKYMTAMHERAVAWADIIARYESGDWPSSRHVTDMFGRFGHAIEEAGFTPRAPGQHTRRGFMPSPRLLRLGHVIAEVYDAERAGDMERLVVALDQLARVARATLRDVQAERVA